MEKKLDLTTLLSKDLKKFKIKKLTDKELHELLVKYSKEPNKNKKIKYRNKILSHLLPLIISKCKNLGIDDNILSSTDFINSCILEIIDGAMDTFDVKRQQINRCSLFTYYINYFVKNAINRLNKTFAFGTNAPIIYSLTDLQETNDPDNEIGEFDITAITDIELDSLESPQEELVNKDNLKYIVDSKLLELTPRSTAILVFFFGLRKLHSLTPDELNNMFGLSMVRIGNIKAKTLKVLANLLGNSDIL